MKRLGLILFAILATLFSAQAAMADTATDPTGATWGNSFAWTVTGGMKFVVNNPDGAIINNVTFVANNTANRAYLRYSNRTIISNVSISSSIAVFNEQVPQGTYYLDGDSSGAGWTFICSPIGTGSFPIVGTNINYTAYWDGSSDYTNRRACSVVSITSTNISSSVNIITASLSNLVNGSSFGSVTFSNVTGSLTFDYFNITGTGFCVTYTGNGTGTNCTAGNGASTYYNVSVTESITGWDSVTASTSQGILDLSAYRLFLETSISAFNASNNQAVNTTTSGSLTLPALNGSNNVQVRVAGNYSKNVTCTIPSPLQTASCNATDIYDDQYTFNATDIWNDAAINDFNLVVSNGTLGGVLYTQNTTSGLINLSLLQGYDYFIQFTVPDEVYESVNVTLAGNASSQHYEFEVLPTPSIDVTIRDAVTGNLILENVTIVVTSNVTGETVYTTTGGYFLTDLAPGENTIKLSSANYSESAYVVTAGLGSVVFLTAYLQQNTSEVIFQFVDRTSNAVIQGATVSQQRLVNGTWQTISSRTTDVTGRTIFGYLDDIAYRFIAIADGYTTKTFDLDPILFSTYTIRMDRSAALDFDQDFQSVAVFYNPKTYFDDQQNEVNITFSSPTGLFTSYAYTLSYPGGSKTGSGTDSQGTTFQVPFNITGATITDRVFLNLTYTTTFGDQHNFSYSHGIIVTPAAGTLEANRDNTYGLGLLERLLVGTIFILVIAGLATLAAGSIAGLVVILLLFGVMVYIGFWPWWSIGLSLLVGFALVAGRTD